MSKLDIAKSGYSVPDITDSRDFLFNQKNIFKIAYSGDLEVSVTYVDDGYGGSEGIATSSFSHNLGYVPISFAFSIDFGTQIPQFFPVGAGVAFGFSYWVDNEKLYINVYDYGVFGSIGETVIFNFKYQIMYDKII